MAALTDQITIVIGVLAACFAGPGAALFVLIRRKAKARQSRRSPIGIALLRGPAHSLREQLDEAHNDLIWDLALLMVVPLIALALFLAQSHLRGLPQMARLAPVYALAVIAFIVYMLRKLLKAGTHLDHLKAGDDAEVAVDPGPWKGRASGDMAGEVAVERCRVVRVGAAGRGLAGLVRGTHRPRPGSCVQRQGAGGSVEVARHTSTVRARRPANRPSGRTAVPNRGATLCAGAQGKLRCSGRRGASHWPEPTRGVATRTPSCSCSRATPLPRAQCAGRTGALASPRACASSAAASPSARMPAAICSAGIDESLRRK